MVLEPIDEPPAPPSLHNSNSIRLPEGADDQGAIWKRGSDARTLNRPLCHVPFTICGWKLGGAVDDTDIVESTVPFELLPEIAHV